LVGTLCDTNVLSRPERAQRWTASPFDREELPARAFYATDPGKRDNLDQALFEAAWVEGLDVNEPATIAWAAERAGPDSKRLMAALNESWPAEEVRGALEEFYRLQRPGVRTVILLW
jgi:predicted DsbA family dithiol-disulfide isomerase